VIALYRKEIRALLPFAALCSLMSADIFTRPFTERLDEQTWVGIASYLEGSDGGFGYFISIFATIVAYVAFPREHDERTIELLYSLPVHRVQIFAAKVFAGLTTVWFGLVVLTITDGAQSAFNPTSISGHQWRLDLALVLLALQASLSAVVYAHALLASVFRLFGVIPYILALFFIATLDDSFPPLAWLDPTSIMTLQYEGRDLVVPWSALIGHGILALGALALAYAAWMGPADRISRVLEGARDGVVSKALLGCGAALAIGFLGLVAAAVMLGLEDGEEQTDLGAFEIARRSTDRYLFTYPTSHVDRALALIEAADPIHEAIRMRLRADRGPQLVVDLTEVSGEHLGIAAWTQLRVGIVAEPDPIQCRRTFAHESVHAFQHRLTETRADDRATRSFIEGSAEYLAYEIVPGEAERAHARMIAAASWERHRMTLDDLIDDDRLRARFDTALVYSLGEVWTAAIVETHGEQMIGDLLRAFGRSDAPRDLGPRAVWEDTLRAAGGDLPSVENTFGRLLREIANTERARIDALPRMGGAVAGRDGGDVRIALELDRDPPPGALYYVRIRLGPESEDTEASAIEGWIRAPRRVEFRVPSYAIPGRRFQIMFAMRLGDEGWTWSETWQWASTR
jgi:ABC-type transport system involved in multi-copper enzyme maturation permease subunit